VCRGGTWCREPGVGLQTLTRREGILLRRRERNHFAGRRRGGAVPRPCVHQLPALLEQITATVGSLDFVRDGMRQRHLGNFGREPGPFGRPITETRPEAVHRELAAAHAAQGHGHRHVADRPPGPAAGEYVIALADPLQILEDRDRRIRERNAVLLVRFHALGRDRP